MQTRISPVYISEGIHTNDYTTLNSTEFNAGSEEHIALNTQKTSTFTSGPYTIDLLTNINWNDVTYRDVKTKWKQNLIRSGRHSSKSGIDRSSQSHFFYLRWDTKLPPVFIRSGLSLEFHGTQLRYVCIYVQPTVTFKGLIQN